MQLEEADWPRFGWITDMRPALARARQDDRTVVLGTLVRTVGSSPRPLGSQMLFDGLRAEGYFSGGCLEADVANHAEAVRREGVARRLVYGEGSPWFDIQLLCGGTLEILLERIGPDDPATAELLYHWQRRQLVWWSSDGAGRSVSLSEQAAATTYDGTRYGMSFAPSWRVVVIGRDPIALAIVSLARSSGFEVVVVRPDGPYGPPPIAGLVYTRGDADTVGQLSPDRWTAIVAATHDDDVDDAFLAKALSSDAAYVGVLGARARIEPRRARLRAAGISEARLANLRAPIGAVASGKAPWEVAVSVVAEIMALRHAGLAYGSSER